MATISLHKGRAFWGGSSPVGSRNGHDRGASRPPVRRRSHAKLPFCPPGAVQDTAWSEGIGAGIRAVQRPYSKCAASVQHPYSTCTALVCTESRSGAPRRPAQAAGLTPGPSLAALASGAAPPDRLPRSSLRTSACRRIPDRKLTGGGRQAAPESRQGAAGINPPPEHQLPRPCLGALATRSGLGNPRVVSRVSY